jgi:hypothetical protein
MWIELSNGTFSWCYLRHVIGIEHCSANVTCLQNFDMWLTSHLTRGCPLGIRTLSLSLLLNPRPKINKLSLFPDFWQKILYMATLSWRWRKNPHYSVCRQVFSAVLHWIDSGFFLGGSYGYLVVQTTVSFAIGGRGVAVGSIG